MPFGKWPSFQACVVDMMGEPNNYDKETAEATCGKLKKRLEGKELFKILKSKGSRRVIAQYVAVEGLDKQNDVVPNHRLKEALDDLKSRDTRTHNVMWRHSSYQIGWPLWAFTDEMGDAHHTEVDEYGLWALTEIRNDGYYMADQIWNRILRNEAMGASIAVNVEPGSEATVLTGEFIKEQGLPEEWIGANYWDLPLQFIEPWSLTPTPANQYVTHATVLAKDEFCIPCIERRAEWYVEKGLFKEMPEALQRARQFYINYARKTKGQLRDDSVVFKFTKDMTWEECMRKARANPKVKDPEALCGWLKHHGPNAPKKQLKARLKSINLETDQHIRELFTDS